MSRRGPKERAPASKVPAAAPHRVDTPEESGISDERGTFHAAMRDVKPLKQRAHRAAGEPADLGKTTAEDGRPGKGALRSAIAHAHHVTRKARTAHRADPLEPGPSTPEQMLSGSEPLAFRRSGVRDQTVRKLRRGLFPIDDELDLHGLHQSAAREVLAEFIAQQRDAGRRCVRIIHGKGYRSGARGPILKMLVNDWLRRHHDVIAFCSAREIDGGTGAVYVLLRS
jgi:DNA-nicking Smr family endonuclease